jgi:hypothetical protein
VEPELQPLVWPKARTNYMKVLRILLIEGKGNAKSEKSDVSVDNSFSCDALPRDPAGHCRTPISCNRSRDESTRLKGN